MTRNMQWRRVLGGIAAAAALVACAPKNVPVEQGKYAPNGESLNAWECPEWFKDAKFGSTFGEKNLVQPDMNTCFEYACKAPIDNNLAQTLIVLVENTTEYGGITYMYGDGTALACCPKSADAYPYDFRGIVQHEAGGHGFGKLADEYIYHNAENQV